MDATGIPFGFGTYGTKKGGLIVGAIYEQENTGKKFRFCQAHTTLVGATLNATAATQWDPVVQVGTTTFGLATDDVSAGLLDSNSVPFCLGLPTSQCLESTATETYYFWAQVSGPAHTVDDGELGTWTTTYASVKMNSDDDAAVGQVIHMTSTDASCDTTAVGTAITTGNRKAQVGFVLVAVTAGTDLVTGVWVKAGLE